MGGCHRLSKIIGEYTTLEETTDAAIDSLRTQEGKILFGINLLGSSQKKMKDLLKAIKKGIGSSRFVNKDYKNLSTVQAYHAGLWTGKGTELSFICTDNQWILAKTEAGQNFESYAARDFGKPIRDARVGMLPPKLAQIMINLSQQPSTSLLWDPFCGTGTILLEAALMGHPSLGSDIEEPMIQASKANMSWLQSQIKSPLPSWEVFLNDAQQLPNRSLQPSAIITEGFLGEPRKDFATSSDAETLDQTLSVLYKKSFLSFPKILPPKSPIIITFPLLKGKGSSQFFMQKTLANVLALGYTKCPLLPNKHSVIYERTDQKVLREVHKFLSPGNTNK